MKLRVLGCSGGIGAGLRTTSLLIDDDILIDAGSGLGDLSLDEMCGIRHIFVTHSHLDHVAFIPLLIDTLFDRVNQSIVVHCQETTLQALQEHIFNWVVWPDFAELPHPDRPVLRYEVMAPGDVLDIQGRAVEMIAVNHAVPGAAYRVESGGKAFAFSGDTSTNDTLWQALNAREALDLLILECAFANRHMELSKLAGHYCPSLLAADIGKLRHRPDIYISHLKPGEEANIMAECRELLPGLNVRSLQGGKAFSF